MRNPPQPIPLEGDALPEEWLIPAGDACSDRDASSQTDRSHTAVRRRLSGAVAGNQPVSPVAAELRHDVAGCDDVVLEHLESRVGQRTSIY